MFEFDAIVYAIGLDAITEALDRIDIRGRGGASLKAAWADGPRTYLGLMIAQLPNFFMVTGPGSPSVLANMILGIEQHIDWNAGCIVHLTLNELATIEASQAAQNAWVEQVNRAAERTLYPLANSWYMGANVPGKPRVFMPYVGGWQKCRQKCLAVAANNYEGFILSATGDPT
jgi:cyclohexanone monooxygenase